MDDKAVNAVWPVWLGLPQSVVALVDEETLNLSLAATGALSQPVGGADSLVPVATKADTATYAVGLAVAAWVGCLLFATRYAYEAIAREQAHTLYLLFVAHLPLLALADVMRRILSRIKPLVPTAILDGTEYPRPASGYRLTRCRPSGIELGKTYFLGWEECESWRFVESSDPFFTIVITARPRPPDPKPSRLSVFNETWPAFLPPFSAMLVVAVCAWGYFHFGWRADVSAAFWCAGAHALVYATLFLILPRTLPMPTIVDAKVKIAVQEVGKRSRDYWFVFDSRIVSATDVLNRLSRNIGSER